MKKKTKIIISTLTAILLIGVGLYILIKNNEKTPAIDTDFTQNTLEQVTSKQKMVTVPFKTAEEMQEYTEALNTFSGEEEIETFISSFLNSAEENRPELTITYFKSNIRESILNTKSLPFYDETDSMYPKINNLNISEIEEENSPGGKLFDVSYTMDIYDKEAETILAKFERNDKVRLYKEFGQIFIINYSSETTNVEYM